MPAFLREGNESAPGDVAVQRKCDACAAEDAAESASAVQLWDCSEYQEPTCVQSHTDGSATPVQAKCHACEEGEEKEETSREPVQRWDCSEYQEPTCVQTQPSGEAPVQAKCAACEEEEQTLQHHGESGRSPRAIHREARRGLAGASGPLPHGARIQAAFGRHDVSHVRASVGGSARSAARRMGALAFTAGDRIGFREAPDLRLAAHEAAHTVQQHAGLSLPGNVGRPGDRWERHADRVANAVVEGRSAERLLDEVAGSGAAGDRQAAPAARPAVQRQITSGASRIVEPPSEMEEAPAARVEAEPAPPAAEDVAPAGASEADQPPAMEEAAAGTSETPPEGVTEGPPAAGGGEGASEPAARGGGLNAPCYGRDPDPRPENTEEPTSDPPPGEASAEAQVTFDAWQEELDDCPAEQAVAEGAEQTASTLTQASDAGGGAAPQSEIAAAGPAASGGAGADEASASPEAHQMESAADASAEQEGAAAGGMEGQLAAAESERDVAVADYESSLSLLLDVEARSHRLERGVAFRGDDRSESAAAAAEQVHAFMSAATGQMAGAVAFASAQVPQRLGGMADVMKANIQGAIEVEKGAISDRIAQARAQARDGAAQARAHVAAEYSASMELVEAETSAALAALDTEHLSSLDQVDLKETAGLDDVNARFAAGRAQHEDKGPEYSARAITRGQEHAHAYERCKGNYSDDGFWDGCLTVRRAKAQQDAACKTAAGYKDAFHRTANKKGYDLKELRKQYRCAVIAGARQVNQTLDQTHDQLVSGLERGRMQAIAGLGAARTQNLAAIDTALHATMTALAAQEHAQRQAVNDAGYLKQVAIEQLAHTAAANLGRGIAAAMDSLETTLTSLRETLAQNDAPDPSTLSQTLAAMQLSLGGGMGTLLGRMEEGAAQGEARIADAGSLALEALTGITAGNADQAQQVESGFSQQMSGLMRGASRAFGELAGNHVRQAQESATQGIASMQQAVAGFDEALATIGGRIDEAIATSLAELDRELSAKLRELDGQIASEAWKAAEKEQPAWKSVVAIVLVVLVIIAAAVISIVTLGAGASLFAIILVGALVGAVSAGLIQIINNWASGEAWHRGLAQAMIMGAIGGALGGGLGFAGGALASGAAAVGASAARQLAINVGADLLAEAATQTIGYVAFGQEFSWQGFVTAGAMSGISFRARPAGGAGVRPSVDVPTPAAAGAAGGRRAAVAQVAGGAAVGLGIEGAASLITGKRFDVTRAVSTAASGAVGARASRRGGGGPRTEPTTRLGRAAQRLRTFDPGGVGSRIEAGLEARGARSFGPRPPGGAAEAPTRSGAGEAVSPPARAVDEPATARRLAEGESDAPRRGDATEAPAARRDVPDGEPTTARRGHPDEPEVEPGVVARERSGDHTVKVTRRGAIVVCSSCGELARVFEPEIRGSRQLEMELLAIEAMTNPRQKAFAAAQLHARLVGLRNMANVTVARPIASGGGAVTDMRRVAEANGVPEPTVVRHVQEIVQRGTHPSGVSPDSPYGQQLLRLAEAVVGPRLPEATTPGTSSRALAAVAEHTPESITIAKAKATADARESQRELAAEIATARAAAGSKGPQLRTAREVAADALNPTGEASRTTRIGEAGIPVRETPLAPTNLVIKGLGTYEAIVRRGRAIAARLGMSGPETDALLARAIREFFVTGRTPSGLTGKTRQQRTDANFFAQLERLLLTSETIRSPSNLADVAQVVRAMAEGRLPLDALSTEFPAGLAALRGEAAQGRPREGGSPGSRRALERAQGQQRRDNALDRAADEVLARHGRSAQDPMVQRARDDVALRQAFFNDIIRTLFGGQ